MHLCSKLMAIAGASLATLSANAVVLTPEQALDRALPDIRKVAPSADNDLNLSYTQNYNTEQIPAVYVFSRKNQYLVLSASDCADAILGFADTSFDPDNMPPALQWWLEQYAAQIEEAERSGIKAAAPLKVNRNAIEPLMTTQWDQSTPYNDLCPLINGKRSMTGCVATAMAQVMKYHNWPVKGTGSNSYRQGINTISFNFEETTFDWNNMTDVYGSEATDEQKNAVATLMFAAGVSTNMKYSPSQSGTSDIYLQKGLAEYFKYDKGLRYMQRNNYTSAQWEDTIYNQLSKYGPVLYSGVSNENAHEFVCDGYSHDGYFHFNWGWGGMSDGYFRLNALDPGQQGIGGSLSGYNFSQAIIANVRPAVEGEESPVLPNIMLNGDMSMPETSRSGLPVNITGNFVNYSYLPVSGTFGLKAVNEEDNKVTYTPGASIEDMPSLSYAQAYQARLPYFSNCTLILSPAFRDTDGNWHDIPGALNAVRSFRATVSSGRYTITPIVNGSMEISGLNLETKLYIGQSFIINATAANTGDTEYNAAITPLLLNESDEIIAYGSDYAVNLSVGETKQIKYVGKFTNFLNGTAPTAGTYRLCFALSSSRTAISEPIEVQVRSTSAPVLTASGFRLVGDSDNANAAELEFTARITCMGGYLGGALDIAIFPEDGDYSVAIFAGAPMFLGVLDSGTFTAKGAISNPVIGGKYLAGLYYGENLVCNYIPFTIGKNESGIDAPEQENFSAYPNPTSGPVMFSERVTHAEVYSIAGALMYSADNVESIDIESLPAGIYLLRATTESAPGSVVTRRLIKK